MEGAAAERELSLRPITDQDMPFAEALYAANRLEEFAASGWPPGVLRQFLSDQFRLRLAHYRHHYPEAEWLIVELRNAPIGQLYIDETPRRVHVVDVTLLPFERSQGHGTAILIDLLTDAARKEKAVSLHVEQTSRALSLYRRLGFAVRQDRGSHLLMEYVAKPVS